MSRSAPTGSTDASRPARRLSPLRRAGRPAHAAVGAVVLAVLVLAVVAIWPRSDAGTVLHTTAPQEAPLSVDALLSDKAVVAQLGAQWRARQAYIAGVARQLAAEKAAAQAAAAKAAAQAAAAKAAAERAEKAHKAPAQKRPERHVATGPSTAGCGRWRATIASLWPADQVATACRIMMRESRGIPTARNPSGASGLMQIMLPLHANLFRARGWCPCEWSNGYKNLVVAHDLWLGSGWSPWAL